MVSLCLWIIGERPAWTSVWMFGFHCNCCCCCSLSSLKAAFSLIGWLSANYRLLPFSHLFWGFWTGCTFLQLCKKISCNLQSQLRPPLPPVCVCLCLICFGFETGFTFTMSRRSYSVCFHITRPRCLFGLLRSFISSNIPKSWQLMVILQAFGSPY
jgi:hypothetical protein